MAQQADKAHAAHADVRSADPAVAAVAHAWLAADINQDGVLSMSELKRVLDTMNIGFAKRDLARRIADSDANGDGRLDYLEFRSFYSRLVHHADAQEAFADAAGSTDINAIVSPAQLAAFMKRNGDALDDAAAAEAAEAAIALHAPGQAGLRLGSFFSWLTSPSNMLMRPEDAATVHMDMTQPMTRYWINSSHNTYLVSDQVAGASSYDMYRDALLAGCRCVELDCWDGPNGEPIIYHGHTLTSKLDFGQTIKTIRQHAFTTSPYPVILSLENHCSVPQQERMAAILQAELGDSMPTSWLSVPEYADALPAPAALLRCFLIKAKTGVRTHVGQEGAADDTGLDDVDEDEPPGTGAESPASPVSPSSAASLGSVSSGGSAKTKAVAPALAALVHLRGLKFRSFDESSSLPATTIHSLSEKKIAGMLATLAGRQALAAQHERLLTRTYPRGLRLRSSNYDPAPLWALGAQVVALNFQTPGLAMWSNAGLFRSNGGAGYVLKPDSIRVGASAEGAPLSAVPTQLTVRIVSAWRMPKSPNDPEIIDPYVMLHVTGDASDVRNQRTKAVRNNGLSPVWDETFVFHLLRPELDILVFHVYDHDRWTRDDLIGQYALPISSLRRGWRSVPLCDAQGRPHAHGVLLVHVSVDPVTG